MSRKPIFPSDMKQTQLFSTGRQADTRVNQLKKTDLNLYTHSPPFSGISTANQSQTIEIIDENSPIVQNVLKILKESENSKAKEFQNQLDVFRNMLMELRGQKQQQDQLNKLIFSLDDSVSLSTKIIKATEELVKQQEQFQINYQQRLTEIRQTTEQNNILIQNLDSKFKSSRVDKFQVEFTQRINVLEEQMIAQFKNFQSNYQNYITVQNKKLNEEFDIKLNQLQLQINTKTFSDVNVKAVSPKDDLLKQKMQNLETQFNDLNAKNDYNQSTISKIDSSLKQLIITVNSYKEETEGSIFNQKLELQSVRKDLYNQFDNLNEKSLQFQKQNEDIRKSYQDMLFSFKQNEQQKDWAAEYNRKQQEISCHQVQVYSYDEEIEDNKPNNEVNKIDNDDEFIDDKQPPNIVKQSSDQNKNISSDLNDETEEVTYQLDEQGYLMDDQGNYILDDNGSMIQLNQSQIDYLRKQDMVQEEDE